LRFTKREIMRIPSAAPTGSVRTRIVLGTFERRN
jgi:hypothetical protein